MLDQQPASSVTAAAAAWIASSGSDEYPRSFQLVAVECELQIAFLQRRTDVLGIGRPRADVPQHHDARAVAFRNDTLEFSVRQWVIFHVHGEPFDLGIE